MDLSTTTVYVSITPDPVAQVVTLPQATTTEPPGANYVTNTLDPFTTYITTRLDLSVTGITTMLDVNHGCLESMFIPVPVREHSVSMREVESRFLARHVTPGWSLKVSDSGLLSDVIIVRLLLILSYYLCYLVT